MLIASSSHQEGWSQPRRKTVTRVTASPLPPPNSYVLSRTHRLSYAYDPMTVYKTTLACTATLTSLPCYFNLYSRLFITSVILYPYIPSHARTPTLRAISNGLSDPRLYELRG